MSTRPSTKVISRDSILFLIGCFLMIWQGVFADPFNLAVFLGGLGATGSPLAIQIMAMITGRPIEQSSPSPAPPPSPEPSLPSSGA